MDRNWLIRTKNLHILGPVSKTKIKELIENGSIKGDDEVCSGNGYWFFIKEDDLVKKYIHDEIIQDFNPVSEATVVGSAPVEEDIPDDTTQVLKLPTDNLDDDDDSFDETEDEGNSNIQEFREFRVDAESDSSDDDDEDYEEDDPSTSPQKKTKQRAITAPKQKLTGNLLVVVLVFFFILVLLGFYFRKRLLSQIIGQALFIDTVHAQEFVAAPKKKT
jgi:hypothetical protein